MAASSPPATVRRRPAAGGSALAHWLTEARNDDLPVVLVPLGADFARPVAASCDLVAWWNRQVAAPKIRLSTNAAAHRDLESRCRLPLVTGHFPDAWSNLGLGLPDLSVQARRSALALRRAEQVAAWRTLCGAGGSDLDADAASDDLLRHHEHTYGLEGHCDRYLPGTLDDLQQTAGPLHRADQQVRTAALHDLSALGRCVRAPGDGPVIAVFNHLPRPQTALATVRVHIRHLRHRAAWQVRDLATGQVVPHQTDPPLTDQPNYHQTTHRHLLDLHLLASKVPALGWRLYRLEAIDGATAVSPLASWTERPGGDPAARLVWPHGEVDIDHATGAILAWRHAGRDLCRPPATAEAPLLGECRLLGYRESCAKPKDFTDKDRFYRCTETLRPRLDHLAPLPAGPLFGGFTTRFRLGRQVVGQTRITCHAHAPVLDVDLLIERPDSLDIEALVMAWPTAIADPAFAGDAGGLTVDPLRDLAPGAYRDHLATDRWAAVHGAGGALVLCSPDAPATSFGGMHLLSWRRDWPATMPGDLWSILSLNGHWRCGNVTRRNRESAHWRFRLCPLAAFDPLAAQDLGEAMAFPLTATLVEAGAADGTITTPSGRFVILDENDAEPSGVQLAGLRLQADALVLRLAERAGRDRRLRLGLPGQSLQTIDLAAHAVVEARLAFSR